MPNPSTSRRRRPFTRASVLLVGLATACLPPAPPPGWEEPYLTRSDGDTITVEPLSPDAVRFVGGGSDPGTDTRVLLDRIDTPLSNDQTSCSTSWNPGGWPAQEGVAVRILIQGDRTRAVTVTKNVWQLLTGIYNVHLWDTSRPEPYLLVAGFDMSGAIGVGDTTTEATARRLCVRVRGQELTFKVWPAAAAEPPWSSPVHVRSVLLPPQGVHAGRPGWYHGHLGPGKVAFHTGMWTGNDDPPGTPLVK